MSTKPKSFITYPCTYPGCGKICANKSRLTRHLQTHQQSKYKCNQCSRSYGTERGLKRHVGLAHVFKQHKCQQCDKAFTEVGALRRHQKRHIQGEDEAQVEQHDDPNSEIAAAVSCSICSETFPNQASLSRHILRHTLEKFACLSCGLPFPSYEEVERHERFAHPEDENLTTAMVGSDKESEGGDDNQSEAAMISKQSVKRKRSETIIPSIESDDDSRSEKAISLKRSVKRKRSKVTTQTDDSDDDEAAKDDDEEEVRVMRQNLFSDKAVQRVSSQLKTIRNTLRNSYLIRLPETTSPAQQLLMGRNLRAFEQSQLVEPLPTLASISLEPSKNLKSLLDQPRRQKIHFRLDENHKEGICEMVRFQNFNGNPKSKEEQYQDMDIARYNLSKSNALKVAGWAAKMLSRIPVLLREYSDNHRQWLFSAASRLAFDECPDMKLVLSMPKFKKYAWEGTKRYLVVFHVKGYDHNKCYAWNKQIKIPLSSQLDLDRTIDIPDEDRIVWVGGSGEVPSESLTNYSQAEWDQCLRLAQALTARYYGFIGTFEDCKVDTTHKTSEFWIKGKSSAKMLKEFKVAPTSPWNGEPLWNIQRKTTFVVFSPAVWVMSRLIGKTSYITVHSVEPERLLPVAVSMLNAVLSGCTPDTIWGVGAAVADEANRQGNEPSPPIVSCSVESHKYESHVCPECLGPKPCRDFEQTAYLTYSICRQCAMSLDKLRKSTKVDGGAMGYVVLRHLRQENAVLDKKLTADELKQKSNQAIKTLQFMMLPDGRSWHDAYVDIILDSQRNKPLSWDAVKMHPLMPSLDAIDPVVPGEDGRTHYHYLDDKINNLVITSDCINRAKQHHQVVILHGILHLVESADRGKEAYEKGIAIVRNCLINHYEYGIFGHSQQAARIGKPIPHNMDAMLRSFRTAELLERTEPPERVWRMYSARPVGSLAQRVAWRPSSYAWLLDQLHCIETRVFNFSAQLYRTYWMKPGVDGTEVFWPFSQYNISLNVHGGVYSNF